MSEITEEEVKKIATLANLALTPQEVTQATKDLSGILHHFSLLQEIDTAHVQEEDTTTLVTIVREDCVVDRNLGIPKTLIENTPHHKDTYVHIPYTTYN